MKFICAVIFIHPFVNFSIFIGLLQKLICLDKNQILGDTDLHFLKKMFILGAKCFGFLLFNSEFFFSKLPVGVKKTVLGLNSQW